MSRLLIINTHIYLLIVSIYFLHLKQSQCLEITGIDDVEFRNVILLQLNNVNNIPNTLLTEEEATKIQTTILNPRTSKPMLNYIYFTLENYVDQLHFTPETLRDNYFYTQMKTLGPINENLLKNYNQCFENLTDIDEVRLIKDNLMLAFVDWIKLIENQIYLNKDDSKINEFELLDETFEVVKFRKQIRDDTQVYSFPFVSNTLGPINEYIDKLRIVLNYYYNDIAKINLNSCYLRSLTDMKLLVNNKNSSAPIYHLMGKFITNIFYINNVEYYKNTYQKFVNDMLKIMNNEVKSYENDNDVNLDVTTEDILRFLFNWVTNTVKDNSPNSWYILEHYFHEQTFKQIFLRNTYKPNDSATRIELINDVNKNLPVLTMAINLANGDLNFLQQLRSINDIVQVDSTSTEMLILCRNIIQLGLKIDHTMSMRNEMSNLELEYMTSRLKLLGSVTKNEVNNILLSVVSDINNIPGDNLVLLVGMQWKNNILNELGKQENDLSRYYQILDYTFPISLQETIDYLNKKIFYKLICNDNKQIIGIYEN